MNSCSEARLVELSALRPGWRVEALEPHAGRLLADKVRLALSAWRRFVGLMGTSSLDPGEGMFIAPCKGVHTCWMRYPIDVLFLAKDGTIVEMRTNLQPWRMTTYVPDAFGVFELPAGAVQSAEMSCGQRVAFRRVE